MWLLLFSQWSLIVEALSVTSQLQYLHMITLFIMIKSSGYAFALSCGVFGFPLTPLVCFFYILLNCEVKYEKKIKGFKTTRSFPRWFNCLVSLRKIFWQKAEERSILEEFLLAGHRGDCCCPITMHSGVLLAAAASIISKKVEEILLEKIDWFWFKRILKLKVRWISLCCVRLERTSSCSRAWYTIFGRFEFDCKLKRSVQIRTSWSACSDV